MKKILINLRGSEDKVVPNKVDDFIETYAIVKGKIANKIPMTTAKEELMEQFLLDWNDAFGLE